MSRHSRIVAAAFLLLFPAGFLPAQQPALWPDPSPHTVQFITVTKNVKLEVLDWGGAGRPLVLLAGLGETAHVYDDFAPKLTPEFHVYGITRRGFGASSKPDSGYLANQLGNDVIAVLDALKLDRPVLVGHSIAGEELSSVGSRHPERVAGLVYLDAAYGPAFHDPELQEVQKNLPRAPQLPPIPAATDADRATFHSWGLRLKNLYGLDPPESEYRETREITPEGHVGDTKPNKAQEVIEGEEQYTKIPVPVLAIYAIPHDQGPYVTTHLSPEALAAIDARDAAAASEQARAFKEGVPSARVVILPHANHYLFMSNEADVLREIRAFLAALR
jgi:pimeloyl-ACP methyl ester carboxylesterase